MFLAQISSILANRITLSFLYSPTAHVLFTYFPVRKTCSYFPTFHIFQSIPLQRHLQNKSSIDEGARGGLGGYSPRRKVKSDFSDIFGITENHILAPLVGRASPPVGKFLAPHLGGGWKHKVSGGSFKA